MILGTCSACLKNFRKVFCELTCSPNQSDFVVIKNTQEDEEGKESVIEVDYYITEEMGTKFFDSCNDITLGMSNSPIWSFLFPNSKFKSYKELLPALGTPVSDGGPSTYKINFPDLYDTKINPCNFKMLDCDDPVDGCACVDCSKKCAPPEKWISYHQECKINGINCGILLITIIYPIILGLFVSTVIFIIRRKKAEEIQDEEILEDNAPLLDERMEKQEYNPVVNYKIDTIIQKWFYRQGFLLADYSSYVVIVSIILFIGATVFLIFRGIEIETDPIKLWVRSNSPAWLAKQRFDKNFDPFYRIEQVIMTKIENGIEKSIVEKEYIRNLFKIIEDVQNLKAITEDEGTVSLKDICVEIYPGQCIIQTITDIWESRENFENSENWKQDFINCINNPTSCIQNNKPPIMPNVVLGGFDPKADNVKFDGASTFVLTFLLKNNENKQENQKAILFENYLIDYFKSLSNNPEMSLNNIRLSFSTENSVEVEINRESFSDIFIVVLSYIVMFVYVSFALGSFSRNWKQSLVYSRFSLAICGISIVITSIVLSVTVFSILQIKTTMIIAEVIPFLVLAVGVDNIFIIVHSFDQIDESMPINQKLGLALSKTGPNILLTSISEIAAFGIGGFVSMPAVSSFSLYAAVAIFFDFMMQITVFISLLAIDAKRRQSGRMDLVPCLKLNVSTLNTKHSFLSKFIGKFYSPYLENSLVKACIVALYGFILCFGISGMFKVEMGLDQKLAVPDDSYLIPYFEDISKYLLVGPPLYFVLENVDVTSLEGKKLLAGRKFEDINLHSISSMLEVNRKVEKSYIAAPTAIWFDDYMAWLNICCKKLDNGDYDPDRNEFSLECQESTRYLNQTLSGTDLLKFFPYFLEEMPSEKCSYAGKAAYSSSIVMKNNKIVASTFRTYLEPLRSQADFINSLKSIQHLTDRIIERNNLKESQFFPYSLTFVYFEQYLTLVNLSIYVICIALAVIFVINWILLQSFLLAGLVLYMIASILVILVGSMGWWNISLNAVSLVNIVIAAGISVEFIANIARGYLIKSGTRNARVRQMIEDTGCSVLMGITLTKFFGVFVLAFAKSKIFELFYFRMYLLIVLIGAFHGLVVFPVVLSILGPKHSLKPVFSSVTGDVASSDEE